MEEERPKGGRMSEEQKRRRKELRSECRELEEKGARLHPIINYISKRDDTLLKLANLTSGLGFRVLGFRV